MKAHYSNKLIWTIAYPIMLGNLAQTLISITDTAFLGHVSNIALGASMVAGVYYYVFSTLAWGFGIGIQIMVARRLGEQRFERIGVIFNHGLCVVAGLAILLFCLQHFCTEWALKSLIQSPNIYEAAIEFMKYRHYGIVFVCFNYLFRAFYIGLSNTKCISISTAIMASVNIFLDYALIFGKCGFPEMGIGGAALASVCAEITALIFFFTYTYWRIPLQKYSLFVFHKFEGWLFRTILNLSLPTMGQKLLTFGTWFFFFILVEHMGEQEIAVSGIIRSVYMLIGIPAFAFGATANTLTSRLIGENHSGEVVRTLFQTLRISLLCLAPVMLFCILCPQLLLSIYTSDPILTEAAIPSLYMICLAVLAMSFGMIFFEAVSGTGNTVAALILEIFVQIAYVFSIWLFAVHIGTNVMWVWSSELTYGLIIGLLSGGYMRWVKWQKKL